MIRRRYLLLGGLAGVVGFAGLRLAFTSDEDSIAAILHKRLDYLKLDADGVRAFARDLAAKHSISSVRLRSVGAMGPLYGELDPTRRDFLSNGIRHGEERVVTGYLLSSDFFLNGSDESRIVRYLGFYDPLHACGNPFARRVV
jgi:hypothetical protein